MEKERIKKKILCHKSLPPSLYCATFPFCCAGGGLGTGGASVMMEQKEEHGKNYILSSVSCALKELLQKCITLFSLSLFLFSSSVPTWQRVSSRSTSKAGCRTAMFLAIDGRKNQEANA